MNDLQNFVNVALATAAGGEDALTHDKLSNLRTVGSHFGALIYNLKEKADFRTLADGCKLVWQAMERTSSLPKLLVSDRSKHKNCSKLIFITNLSIFCVLGGLQCRDWMVQDD